MNFSSASGEQGRRRVSVFDLTPMIDVVLQLIIFFMYTTQFSSVVRSQLDLPKERGEVVSIDARPELVIDVEADGSILVAGVRVDEAKLASMVSAEIRQAGGEPAGVRVLLRADRAVPAARIDRIARTLTDLDVRSWRAATEATGVPLGAPGAEGGGG